MKLSSDFLEATGQLAYLPPSSAILVWIEDMLYSAAVQFDDESRQRARETLSKLSRRLAEAKGHLVDAYSLTRVVLRRHELTSESLIETHVALLAACASITALLLLAGMGIAWIFAPLALIPLAGYQWYRSERRVLMKISDETSPALDEFYCVVRWLGFDPANLTSMKRTLPEFRDWEALRHLAENVLVCTARQIICWKKSTLTAEFTEEEKTRKVREAEDNFFPFHRRLAACDLADKKVDGYFDKARSQLAKWNQETERALEPAPAGAR